MATLLTHVRRYGSLSRATSPGRQNTFPQVARLTGTATKAAADVYLAEVNLALGDFKGAEEAATRVINGTDGSYSIMKTRFGSRKDEATDRYGNTLNPYWDLFRQAWGRDASGNAVKKRRHRQPKQR